MAILKDLLRKAERGRVSDIYKVAQHYYFALPRGKENRRKAYEWYLAAAIRGHLGAQWYVGVMLREGDGIQKNTVRAVKWFEKAAFAGDAGSMCALGYHLFYGEGIRKDRSAGVRWYRKSARKHDPDALLNLGLCYYRGEVVKQNYSKAAHYFKKAERAPYGNSGRAQQHLAYMYEKGMGVRKSERWARYWREKAEGIRNHRGVLKTPEYYQKLKRNVKNISTPS